MLLKTRRFIKTTPSVQFILMLVLVISLISGTVVSAAFLGWPDEGTFRVAVDKGGNIRLLSPDINGEHNDELKKNEFLIELPSRQLIAQLEGLLSELEITISALESEVGGQQGTISSLQSTISSLQSIIGGLESEVSGQQDTIK